MQIQESSEVPKSNMTHRSNAGSEEEENNAVAVNVQTSSSCGFKDDSNASQEVNAVVLSACFGEARASRGSATDPQSLYARVQATS